MLYASETATYVRNIEKKKDTDVLRIFRSQELLPVSLETRVQYGGGEITRSRETWFDPKNIRPRYISALKKVVPDLSRPKKSRHYSWCTEWAWNWQIIFRFASIHGRACFNRWKEHPCIVLQYTPKSTQK